VLNGTFFLPGIPGERDPLGDIQVMEAVDRRHPNIGSHLLDVNLRRCNLVPVFTKSEHK